MPRCTFVQVALVEVAAAAVLGGAALGHVWRVAGAATAVVLLVAALVPVQRRWLYQLAASWVRLRRRRRQVSRAPGLAGLLGGYSVEQISGGGERGGRAGAPIGVVSSRSTWCLPLELDDPPDADTAVSLDLLTGLLQVEDVALSSVRLITVATPAPPPTRYCLLTLDARRAVDAIAARGGSQDAVHQILRRCAIHAEGVFAASGIATRRLGANAVESLFVTWLGPAGARNGRRADQTVETWVDVRAGGIRSTSFTVTGRGADLADRVARLAAAATTPVVATSLVIRHGRRPDEIDTAILLRLSAPESQPHGAVARPLALVAPTLRLAVQVVGGEQGALLAATTPIGMGETGRSVVRQVTNGAVHTHDREGQRDHRQHEQRFDDVGYA